MNFLRWFDTSIPVWCERISVWNICLCLQAVDNRFYYVLIRYIYMLGKYIIRRHQVLSIVLIIRIHDIFLRPIHLLTCIFFCIRSCRMLSLGPLNVCSKYFSLWCFTKLFMKQFPLLLKASVIPSHLLIPLSMEFLLALEPYIRSLWRLIRTIGYRPDRVRFERFLWSFYWEAVRGLLYSRLR